MLPLISRSMSRIPINPVNSIKSAKGRKRELSTKLTGLAISAVSSSFLKKTITRREIGLSLLGGTSLALGIGLICTDKTENAKNAPKEQKASPIMVSPRRYHPPARPRSRS